MNTLFQNLVGGMAGALALTVTHQLIKHSDKQAPRLDILGEEAVEKSAEAMGVSVPSGSSLSNIALAGDLGANTIYYRMIGNGPAHNLVWRGLGYGLLAGIGALSIPAKLGMDDTPVTKTTQAKNVNRRALHAGRPGNGTNVKTYAPIEIGEASNSLLVSI